MKFRILFVALGLLTLFCAASQADDILYGDAYVTAGIPLDQYTAGPNGTAAVAGQSSHYIHYTNNSDTEFQLIFNYALSLNLGGTQAQGVNGSVSTFIAAGDTYTLLPNNPTCLNVSGNFSPGKYLVEAQTTLDATFLGLQTAGNPIGSRYFKVVPAATPGPGPVPIPDQP